jgi:hypothetical protein
MRTKTATKLYIKIPFPSRNIQTRTEEFSSLTLNYISKKEEGTKERCGRKNTSGAHAIIK